MMNVLPLFMALPLFIAVSLPLSLKISFKLRNFLILAAPIILLIFSILLAVRVYPDNVFVYKMGGWAPPLGINLVLDGLSSFFLLLVSFISLLVLIYALDYMKENTSTTRFYTLFFLMLTGMNGVILTGDLFNLFVFLEIASIASYALVAFGVEAEEIEAAFKYTILGTIAATFVLFGILLIYGMTGSLNMADISRFIIEHKPAGILVCTAIMLVGFFLKAAVMPFHAWLPDAYPAAPAPVSAALAGLSTKVIGVYAIMRFIFNVVGFNAVYGNIFMVLGAASMVLAAYLAIGQKDFKRMLSYSSISQIGYIMLGLGIATPMAIAGALFHVFNHANFKALLFLNSGAVEQATGTRKLDELGGLSAKMPITGATSLIGSLSIAGIPPLNGFWSKFLIIMAAVASGHYVYATLAVLVSVITLAYFLKAQKEIFWGDLSPKFAGIKEASIYMSIPVIILAAVCIITGLAFPWVIQYLLSPAATVLIKGLSYFQAILGG